MTENNSIPESTPTTTPEPLAPRPDQGAPAATPRRSRNRTLLFAGGAVVAAVVLAGGGIAIGAAIADEADEDDRRIASDSSGGQRAVDDTRTSSEDSTSGGSSTGIATALGTDSAAELSDIITTAGASAEGDAVGIEANRDGSWDVQFETAAGAETEVRVATDGTAQIVSTDAADADDSAPQGVLDVDTVDRLVAAALAEVDGTVTDIEIGDDSASPYDISVLGADGRTVELELGADLSVLSLDRD